VQRERKFERAQSSQDQIEQVRNMAFIGGGEYKNEISAPVVEGHVRGHTSDQVS